MKVLVIGGGGREHALCWKLAQSPLCDALYCAPGNPGIAEVATLVGLDVANHAQVAGWCVDTGIDLVVVGPEVPLVAGLADDLAREGIKVFGPSAFGAQLEGSKSFTKGICRDYGIPTARYEVFTDAAKAEAFIREAGAPIVIKADGLAAGKGVVVATTVEEAVSAAQEILSGRFGEAGGEIVVEEFLEGEEVSFFAMVDGSTALPLASAQDHKRVGDGDTGPNTGGMGAYSPAPALTPALADQVMREIIHPTVAAMQEMGHPYVGVLYAGLMLTKEGPKLIEYNCRFGDPECQVLMLRLKSDLLPALLAACDGGLQHFALQWHDAPALTVVMAAKGYPETPVKGGAISGIETANAVEGVTVFHAGTAMKDGQLVANGGRVLNVCARAATLREAQGLAYDACGKVNWADGFYRRDIGWRAL
jgi:phosphoribosylamine---glycine ligase